MLRSLCSSPASRVVRDPSFTGEFFLSGLGTGFRIVIFPRNGSITAAIVSLEEWWKEATAIRFLNSSPLDAFARKFNTRKTSVAGTAGSASFAGHGDSG